MNFSIRQRWVLVTVLGLMLSLALGVAVGLLDSKSVRAQDLACQFPLGSIPTGEIDSDRDGLSDTIERSPFPLEYLRNQYDQATRVSTKDTLNKSGEDFLVVVGGVSRKSPASGAVSSDVPPSHFAPAAPLRPLTGPAGGPRTGLGPRHPVS